MAKRTSARSTRGGSWIQVYVDLKTSRKVKLFQRKLGLTNLSDAVGRLACLWTAVLDSAPDGDISKWTDEEIALCCECDDDPRKLVEALRESRLIVDGKVKNWFLYCGSHKNKLAQQKSRATKKTKSTGKSVNDSHMTVSQQSSNVNDSHVTVMRIDREIDREIERKKERKKKKTDCAKDKVEEVWSAYLGHHPRAVLDEGREKMIKARLKLYPVDRCQRAIHGLHNSEWHIGGNPNGIKYLDLKYALKDSATLEAMEKLADGAPIVVQQPKTHREIDQLFEMEERLNGHQRDTERPLKEDSERLAAHSGYLGDGLGYRDAE